MIESANRRNDYIGNNTTDTYSYTFKIFNKLDLIVVKVDTDGLAVTLAVDVDYTVSDVGITDGGQIVLTAGNLETGFKLIILGGREALQEYDVRNRGSFYPITHENFFDHAIMLIQQIKEVLSRSVKLPSWIKSSDFDPTLPDAVTSGGEDKYLGINDAGTGFEIKTPAGGGGGGLIPIGGDEYALLEKDPAATELTRWTDPLVYQGYTERFSQIIDLSGVKATIDYIMDMGYAPPTVSLATSPSYSTLRERGDLIISTDLTATIVKVLDDIATVRFYNGATLLDTQVAGGGIPSGGVNLFTDPTDFSTTTTFSVQVDDVSVQAKPSATSSRTFNFYYPYYYGAGAAGLGAGVSALTKQIIAETTSTVRSFTVNGSQKMYFSYPASYGTLTSILDINSFNTVADWTLTVANITGLDGNPVSYNIYEFNNFAVAGTFQYTFIQ